MNKFIESFELIKEYRGIKPFKIEFKEGLNIIVGENGAGKSSICKLIDDSINNKKEAEEYVILKINEKVKINVYDTEKMNPRTKSHFEEGDIIGQINSLYVSHGQSNLKILISSREIYNQVFILDEPEAGISLLNQHRLSGYYNRNAISNGNQFVIMTHSLPIMSSVEEVYSMDDKEWVPYLAYTNNILKGSKILVL